MQSMARIRTVSPENAAGEVKQVYSMAQEHMGMVPNQVTDQDFARLRDIGCTDEEILEATMVAAFFNCLDRVADALGVALDDGKNEPLSASARVFSRRNVFQPLPTNQRHVSSFSKTAETSLYRKAA